MKKHQTKSWLTEVIYKTNSFRLKKFSATENLLKPNKYFWTSGKYLESPKL